MNILYIIIHTVVLTLKITEVTIQMKHYENNLLQLNCISPFEVIIKGLLH
jgi:hypothetical protein